MARGVVGIEYAYKRFNCGIYGHASNTQRYTLTMYAGGLGSTGKSKGGGIGYRNSQI